MNIQFYLEKLKESQEFDRFLKENPSAFLCGGFFILDKKNTLQDQQNLDFFIPVKKEMISFNLKNFEKNKIELVNKEIEPIKIPEEIDFDFKEIENLLEKKINEQKIKNKAEKFLFSLQRKNNENFLIGTIFLDKLSLIKFQINLSKKEITDFEKKSFFDLIKFIKKEK